MPHKRTREALLREYCEGLTVQPSGRPKTPSDLTAKEADGAWCKYLLKWRSELLHNAHIVVMNRHTHEHQATCAGAGKDGKGKGKWMCR